MAARCYHGGAAFVYPVIQDYSFLDLAPIQIEINLQGALSQQNIRANVPSAFDGRHQHRAGRHGERRRTPARHEPGRDPGAGQGHHLRPDARGHRDHADRGRSTPTATSW